MTEQDSPTTSITRRRFVALTGTAVAGAALAACGGGQGAQPAAGKLESELNVLNWGDYIDFAIKPFEKKYGIKVNMEHYGSEAQAFAKVRQSPGRYDTFNVGVGYLEPAVAQGLVQPIDVTQVPSYKDSFPAFQPGPFEVNGKTYGVAYAWGTNALAYNQRTIPKPVKSWAAFWDPAFKGRTALVDKHMAQFIAACLYLGIDFKQPKEREWPRIKHAMIARAKNMRTLWTTGDDLQRYMVQGEVVLADCYDGLGHTIHAKDQDIVYLEPREGTPGWFDGPEVLTGAPHPRAALAWINFVTSMPMQIDVMKKVNYKPGNRVAPTKASAKLRTSLGLQKPEATLSSVKFWRALGPEWDQRIADAWSEAKAS